MRLRVEKLDTRFPYGIIPIVLFFFLLVAYFWSIARNVVAIW